MIQLLLSQQARHLVLRGRYIADHERLRAVRDILRAAQSSVDGAVSGASHTAMLSAGAPPQTRLTVDSHDAFLLRLAGALARGHDSGLGPAGYVTLDHVAAAARSLSQLADGAAETAAQRQAGRTRELDVLYVLLPCEALTQI